MLWVFGCYKDSFVPFDCKIYSFLFLVTHEHCSFKENRTNNVNCSIVYLQLSPSRHLSFSLSLSLSLFLSLSLSLALCFSLPLSISLSLFISLIHLLDIHFSIALLNLIERMVDKFWVFFSSRFFVGSLFLLCFLMPLISAYPSNIHEYDVFTFCAKIMIESIGTALHAHIHLLYKKYKPMIIMRYIMGKRIPRDCSAFSCFDPFGRNNLVRVWYNAKGI